MVCINTERFSRYSAASLIGAVACGLDFGTVSNWGAEVGLCASCFVPRIICFAAVLKLPALCVNIITLRGNANMQGMRMRVSSVEKARPAIMAVES